MNAQKKILLKILQKCQQNNIRSKQVVKEQVKQSNQLMQDLVATQAFSLVLSSRIHLKQFNKNQKKIDNQIIFKKRNIYRSVQDQNLNDRSISRTKNMNFHQLLKQKQNHFPNKISINRQNNSSHSKQSQQQVQVQFGNYIRLPQIKQKIDKIYQPRNASLCQNTLIQKNMKMDSKSSKNSLYFISNQQNKQNVSNSFWLSNQTAIKTKMIKEDISKLDLLRKVNSENIKKKIYTNKNKIDRFFSIYKQK